MPHVLFVASLRCGCLIPAADVQKTGRLEWGTYLAFLWSLKLSRFTDNSSVNDEIPSTIELPIPYCKHRNECSTRKARDTEQLKLKWIINEFIKKHCYHIIY